MALEGTLKNRQIQERDFRGEKIEEEEEGEAEGAKTKEEADLKTEINKGEMTDSVVAEEEEETMGRETMERGDL